MNFAIGKNNPAPSRIRLYREQDWVLNISVDGEYHSNVLVVRAAPLTQPDRYVCFMDQNGNEICMVEDPCRLDTNSQRNLREELERRYLTSEIQRVHSARREASACYFDIETNRGRREFVIQGTAETIRWLSDHRLLLIDIDGNRFETRDIRTLDRKSAKLLMAMV